MKIAVLGTRGFPGVQGGVEAHCENIYPRLAGLGCEVTVFTRKPYVDPAISSYKNVTLIPIDCPKSKSLEAITHTFRGIFKAKKLNPDILHIHAVGPSMMVPVARLLGMKIVMTNHGPDYKRKKWGMFARMFLRVGEALGSIFANEAISISRTIASDIKKKYNRSCTVIPNGVEIPEIKNTEYALKKFGLEKNKYILAVGRFVPEKGFADLIEAFNKTGSDWKLVIAGTADHEDSYSRNLKQIAKSNPNIVLTGFLSGTPLQELYSHAGLFVLPSYYEGLPIVLLEAMSYGLSCIVSDIPANREVALPEDRYFKAGDTEALARKIKIFISKPIRQEEKRSQIEIVRTRYNWDDIAKRTLEAYKKLIP